MDEAARERLVHNVHHVSAGVKESVLSRVVEYWYNIDRDIGKRSKTASALPT
jgi:catalase